MRETPTIVLVVLIAFAVLALCAISLTMYLDLVGFLSRETVEFCKKYVSKEQIDAELIRLALRIHEVAAESAQYAADAIAGDKTAIREIKEIKTQVANLKTEFQLVRGMARSLDLIVFSSFKEYLPKELQDAPKGLNLLPQQDAVA